MPRHARMPLHLHLPDVRPLDRLRSIKTKLGVLAAATVTLAAFITWMGLNNHLGPTRTLPLAILLSLLVTQVLARGTTSPLREMTAATRAMASGDYSRRVRTTSRDEVGQLALAFNVMAEDLESADQIRRELIANVSHELRTPITALQAQLENLADGVTAPSPAVLDSALAQTTRLSRLVAYLLDLSRVEAGASALDIADLPLLAFLAQAADDVAMVEADKRLDFDVDVRPEDLTVPADAERLRQALTNLLLNAIRHSPPESTVHLRARRQGGSVVIDVVDHGPGIAEADRDRIFERFERGAHYPGAARSATGGTGIGLAIVRWAVSLHGGQIRVEDSEEGAVMRITLPATARPATGPATTGPAAVTPERATTRPSTTDPAADGRPLAHDREHAREGES